MTGETVTILLMLAPLVSVLVGLLFAVLIDPYISRRHRNEFLTVIALVFRLVAQNLLEKKGLRRIRFHDLRHSCASLLIANGVPMKQIQEWLGHSDFSTTANIYAHLDYSSKLSSADALLGGLGLS